VIRFLWVSLMMGVATGFFGAVAIGAAMLRRRGDVYFWCTQQWGRTILRATRAPVVTRGMERIDWAAPHILVSNHISGYDIFALAAVLPVQFYFIGKKELNRIPLFGTAWRAAGHVSIDRSNRATAIASLTAAADRIRRERGVVIIFPEGTRSRTGALQPFKKGAFLMAADASIAIIPVMISGSRGIFQRDRLRVEPRTIELRFGAPVDTTGFPADRADELLDLVRARMLALGSGEAA
jgi:1-acyl-sn-glycerol-3-phosphate acyltransferase